MSKSNERRRAAQAGMLPHEGMKEGDWVVTLDPRELRSLKNAALERAAVKRIYMDTFRALLTLEREIEGTILAQWAALEKKHGLPIEALNERGLTLNLNHCSGRVTVIRREPPSQYVEWKQTAPTK